MISDGIIELGIQLSAECNQNKLLNTILIKAMEITHADGGTLYTPENDKLYFRITKNITMNSNIGFKGEPVSIPPVPMKESYVAAFVAIHQKMINIKDVYQSELFDFSGPKNYDKITGYKTQSMMVVPLVDNYKKTIGVLQLINSTDENGNIVPFEKGSEQLVQLLASFSNIALSNMLHALELKRQMFSFFDVIISAIDERSPYNATHTVRIVEILLSFLDYLSQSEKAVRLMGEITRERKEILIMSAWLHDIGKLVTPLDVLNKSTKLEEKETVIVERTERIGILCKVSCLEGKITKEEYENTLHKANRLAELVKKINSISFLPDEIMQELTEYFSLTFTDVNGEVKPWITDSEREALTIKTGTLTAKERLTIQDHALMTSKLLSKMSFSEKYKAVPFLASSHHELLNGKGYPKKLKADEIPYDVRILTILDIFEALTTKDRPYKKPMPAEKALLILEQMGDYGDLDHDLLSLFKESRCWETPRKMSSYLENELSLFRISN